MSEDKLRQAGMLGLMKVGYMEKDGVARDRHGKTLYRYVSDQKVTDAIREAMMELGLHVKSLQITVEDIYRNLTPTGGCQSHVMLRATLMIEDSVTGKIYGPYEGVGSGTDYGDKYAMKAGTAARKYAFSNACMISWGDDPEADTAINSLGPAAAPAEPKADNGKPQIRSDGVEAFSEAADALMDKDVLVHWKKLCDLAKNQGEEALGAYWSAKMEEKDRDAVNLRLEEFNVIKKVARKTKALEIPEE